jgi:serine/threonine protein kinase
MSETRLQYQNKTYVFNTEDEHAVIITKGKFNSVYKGFCKETQQPVIIKKLNQNLHDTKNIEQYKREFLFNINHPNIIQTIAYVEYLNNHYIIREFADGVDLKRLSLHKKFKTSDIIHYALNILDALYALHEKEIIHCDIRPANIIVNEKTNDAKLIDLGLAKLKNDIEKSPFALIYSPPEQLLKIPKLINETSDFYSLGIVMYEWITGKIPFHHSNPEFMMNLQLTQLLERNKKIPDVLFKVIQKATTKYAFTLPPKYFHEDELVKHLSEAQQQRFQNATEMKDALIDVQKNLPNQKSLLRTVIPNLFRNLKT